MDAHSDHIHYRNEDEARNGVSGFYLCLDGEWDFLYSPDCGKREEEFYREDFSGSKVEKIKVPSHVEMNGYGQIQYINTMYPWEGKEMLRPPVIPSVNPVSQYIRYFDLADCMENDRIILRFEGVESAMYVYLNGEFVGYSEDSFTPSEFDITDKVRKKGNRLCVEVFRYSKSSWLEDQDFFRLSCLCIFRTILPCC